MTEEIEIKIQELRQDLEDGEIDHHEAFEVLSGAIETSLPDPVKDASNSPVQNWQAFVEQHNTIDALIRDKWSDILAVMVSTSSDLNCSPASKSELEGWEPDVENPDSITLKWSCFWSGSDEDRDSFDVPIAILTDRNEFETWANECQAAHTKRKAHKGKLRVESEERRARQQYDALRKRFGKNGKE